LIHNEVGLTFWVPVYGVKFYQNRVRIATVREVTDRQTDRQTDTPVSVIFWLILCCTGWLYISHSYSYSLIMMGICFIVSGAMLYPIVYIQRRRLRREKEQVAETEQEEQVALKDITA